MRPTLYIFVGYPGAGKTTVARLIAEATGAVHLWADKERHERFGKPQLSEAQLQRFYDDLNRHTAQLLRSGRSVVFDTNFNYRSDRDNLRHIAADTGADSCIVWLTTPVEIARLRAVEADFKTDTRVWGNMTHEEFEQLSNKLEIPDDGEPVIAIDGRNVTPQTVRKALGL